jgi:hypothetical protein
MAIYDCFPFNDEVEILRARVRYLASAVDYFVIAESDKTFSGLNKKYFSDEALANLGISESRIVKLRYNFPDKVIRNFSETGDRWHLERYPREVLEEFISNLGEDDFVVLSDVDEIPSIDQVTKGVASRNLVRASTPEYYGKLNWKKAKSDPWLTVKIGPASKFRKLNTLRYEVCPILKAEEGAHFSDLFKKTSDIKHKAQSSAHSEFDLSQEDLETISAYSIRFKTDHRGRFDRRGMGLIQVTKKLSDLQKILLELEPMFFDSLPTPSYFSRVCASYNISNAWKQRPIKLRTDHDFVLFVRALTSHVRARLLNVLSRVSKKLHKS